MARGLGRPLAALVLSDEERSWLEGQVRRHRVARSMSDRCRMILRCADGLGNKAVAAELGVHERKVRDIVGLYPAKQPWPLRPSSVTANSVGIHCVRQESATRMHPAGLIGCSAIPAWTVGRSCPNSFARRRCCAGRPPWMIAAATQPPEGRSRR